MRPRLSSKTILTGTITLLLCLVLAVPAMAQTRESLSSLRADLDAALALIATLQAELAVLQASPVFDLEGLVTVDATNTLEGVVAPHIIVEGANLHVRSGSGDTNDGNNDGSQVVGLGNLIVGYNESNGSDTSNRGGSHNIVIGQQHQ